MPSLTIASAPLADLANLTDRIPVSQGDESAKVITVQQLLANAPPYDLLSDLTETISEITSAGSAQPGVLHVCSGTTANYTVSLPTAVGNAGKLVGFKMSVGLTKIVTIAAAGAENIDGSPTRLMIGGESALLLSDGSNWTKIAGASIPMKASLGSATSSTWYSVANVTFVKMPLATVFLDPFGLCNTSTNRIVIKRPGTYKVVGRIQWYDASSRAIPRAISAIYKNGVNTFQSEASCSAGGMPHTYSYGIDVLAVNDYLELWGLHNTGSSIYAQGGNPVFLSIQEVPTW